MTPVADVAAQSAAADNTSSAFRVFLKDGRALPAYGESAVVGDRVIFSLMVGGGPVPIRTQLVDLPVSAVDLDRTSLYARAVRAAYFAATTGEAEYQSLTSDVASTLDVLGTISDPAVRLQVAVDAQRRLRTWAQEHYDYHGAEIRAFAGQLQEIIGQLRATAGAGSVSMDFVASFAPEKTEPLLPAPTLRESIEAAFSVAAIADDGETRKGVLRTVVDALGPAVGQADLAADARTRLGAEQAADRSYAALRADILPRADALQRAGDIGGLDALLGELDRRDVQLGSRRPALRLSLADNIAARLTVMRAMRAALERYTEMKPQLLAYERLVRPVLSGLDGLKPILIAIRDHRPAGFDTTNRSLARLASFEATLPLVTPPSDLAAVHAALKSVLALARDACAKHRQALIAPNTAVSASASSGAAGALLLLAQARQDLVTHLFPPKAS